MQTVGNATSDLVRKLVRGQKTARGFTNTPCKVEVYLKGRWSGDDIVVRIKGLRDAAVSPNCL